MTLFVWQEAEEAERLAAAAEAEEEEDAPVAVPATLALPKRLGAKAPKAR